MTMKRIWLHWLYSVEMMFSYLASWSRDSHLVDGHLSKAEEIKGEIALYDLNQRMDLFEGERQ
jgi:hypothetical protein